MNRAYLRFEVLRTFRNRRFFFFSLGFPLVLYYLIAGPNRNEHDLRDTGLSAPLYFMVGLAAFGTMNAMLSSGARIAGERAVGWNRQLRITPLSTRTYFRAKVLTGYLMAAMTLCALYVAGLTLGVSLSAHEWARMTGLILVGLLPFAALGIVFGHLLTPGLDRPRDGRRDRGLRDPRRHLVPDHGQHDDEDRRGTAVVLARPGEPCRARRPGLDDDGLGRRRRLDGRGRIVARWAYRRDTRRV